MNEDNNNTPPDFLAAFETEMGAEPSNPAPTPPAPTPPTDPTPPAPTPPSGDEDGDGGKPTPPTPPADEAKVPPADDKKPVEGEPSKPQGEEDPKPADEAPKPLTAEDIRKAIADDRSETQGRVEKLHSASEEIIQNLYPEGIDRNIYDSEGKVIKTAQDIVDRGLINERTNEPYTYEEAASFMLEAGRKMNENIEQLQTWAENIAEQNVSLLEGNERVMEKWGDVLESLSKEDREALAVTYIQKQLKFDKTGSFITEMAMSPEEFYNIALAPYTKYNELLAKNNELEAAKQTQQQQNQQQERNGIPPQRGTSDVKANTGDPFLDALVDELGKA